MSERVELSLRDGKYTLIREPNHRMYTLRYGDPWRDLTGDNLVAALLDRIEEVEARPGTVVITDEDVSDLRSLIRVLDNLSKKRAPDPRDLDAEFFVTANINHAVKSAVYWLPIVERINRNAYNTRRNIYLASLDDNDG